MRNAWLLIAVVGSAVLLVACPTREVDPPEPPTVVSTAPEDGATNVPVTTNIEVEFSQAMDEAAAEGAFSVDPQVECDFSWDAGATTLTCEPQAPLEEETLYTVTIDTGAQDEAGLALEEDFTFSFETAEDVDAPTVVATHPEDGDSDVALNTAISVTFSQAMDQAATAGAFDASPPVDCEFSWNLASTVLTCSPEELLTENTEYTVTIHTGAQDQQGVSLEQDFTFSFTTGEDLLVTCVFDDSNFDECVFGE